MLMLYFCIDPIFAGNNVVLDYAIAEDKGGEVGACKEQIQGSACQ